MINTNAMPAFPCGRDVTLDQFEPTSGMSLRDYFAAKAMHAILTDGSWHGHTSRTAADTAYEVADEMLEARK